MVFNFLKKKKEELEPEFPKLETEHLPPLQMDELPPLPHMESHHDLPDLPPIGLPELEPPMPKNHFMQKMPESHLAKNIPVPEHITRVKAPTKLVINSKSFISMDQYQLIVNALGSIKANSVQCTSSMARIDDLYKNEDEKHNQWQNTLEIIQKKIISIDKKLFK